MRGEWRSEKLLIAEIEQLNVENETLKTSNQELLDERKKLVFNHGERLKELNCHNFLSDSLIAGCMM